MTRPYSVNQDETPAPMRELLDTTASAILDVASDLMLPAPGQYILRRLAKDHYAQLLDDGTKLLHNGPQIFLAEGTMYQEPIGAARMARWTGHEWIFLVDCARKPSIWVRATPEASAWEAVDDADEAQTPAP